MKKIIFALMAMALVALAAGCNKEDPQQKELTLTVSEVTDNTAILNCTFTPKTATTYQLRIGEAVSEEYSKDMQLTIANLPSGKKHTVVATIFDANHKQVGTTEVEFRTTGTPDNAIQKEIIVIDNIMSVLYLEIEITDASEESVTVACTFSPDKYCAEYSVSCDKGGVFNETGRFTETKTLTLSNLNYGTEYTITATLYNTTSGETKNITKTFTKK